MGLRRLSREIVLQTLYSLEFIEDSIDKESKDFLPHYMDKFEDIIKDTKLSDDEKNFDFAINLLQHIVLNIDEIDQIIDKFSKNWSVENIAQIDKSLLRMGIYEIVFTDTPAPIVINEAIEISKKYSSESSGKFINGILNAVAKEHDYE